MNAQTPAEIRWQRLSARLHNEWMLTDPARDGRSERQFAMDAEHWLAATTCPVPLRTVLDVARERRMIEQADEAIRVAAVFVDPTNAVHTDLFARPRPNAA